jgi:hypothetical protein
MALTPEAQMVQAYRQLRTDVRRLLADAKAKGLSHAFLQTQVTEINKAIVTAEATEKAFAAEAMTAEYIDSAADAQHTLTQANAKILSERFTGVDRAAIRNLQTGLAGNLSEMRRALTLGLGLGDPRTAAKAIRQVLDGGSDMLKIVGGVPKVLTKSGQYWDPDAYAKMLGRTAIADSRRVAFGQRYKQNGIDVVKVVGNGSNHPVCIAWEGVSLSLTGETPGYPTVAEARAAGLFHPNCRHRYVMDREAKQGEIPLGPPAGPKAPPPSDPLAKATKVPGIPKAPIPKPLPKPRAPRKPRTTKQLPPASESIDWKTRFDPGVKEEAAKLEVFRHRKDLTAKQIDDVKTYISNEYRRINKSLRKGSVPREARAINAAIGKSSLKKERVLYRGVGGKNPARYGHFQVGAEFEGLGYQSWTVNRGTSASFALGEGAKRGGSPTVFRLRAPKGTKALWIDDMEYEFLMEHKTKYRIVDVEINVPVSRTGPDPVRMRVVTLEII